MATVAYCVEFEQAGVKGILSSCTSKSLACSMGLLGYASAIYLAQTKETPSRALKSRREDIIRGGL